MVLLYIEYYLPTPSQIIITERRNLSVCPSSLRFFLLFLPPIPLLRINGTTRKSTKIPGEEGKNSRANSPKAARTLQGRGRGDSEIPLERMEMPVSNGSAATVIGWERARTVFPTHESAFSPTVSLPPKIDMCDGIFTLGGVFRASDMLLYRPHGLCPRTAILTLLFIFFITPPTWTPTGKIKERS